MEKSNDDKNRFWIEKVDDKKIFVNQNEMNSLLNECYDEFISLKNLQETFDLKYELIKKVYFIIITTIKSVIITNAE